MTEVLYRYEDVVYATPFDDEGRYPGTLKLELREYAVLRRTAKGVWIGVGGDERFVLTTARRRYACLTIEEACESFIARKKAEIRIHEARVARARQALAEIERLP